MNIIDVTLRDGGHAVDFDWPLTFARDYYNTVSLLSEVSLVELGYWGQTSKSKNTFYNLDMSKVSAITGLQRRNNVSVMIDYHYCSKDLDTYPTAGQNEISMIRLCSRKEDIDDALEFGEALKGHTGISVSFNVFNTSNYTDLELYTVARTVSRYAFDYVYFADTHGHLDLTKDFDVYRQCFHVFHSAKQKVGFHLHDHRGLAVTNYRELVKNGVDSTDTSVRGMGKGSGNLRLEHVVDNGYSLSKLAALINDYEDLLSIKPNAYELITSSVGITDNYAKYAHEIRMPIDKFVKICESVSGNDRDNFNKDLMS